MASVLTKPRFDPEAHLQKQGWGGKGTALREGHLTRPLAAVRKKTLSGIGKDRDEAVPFWDNIFAATAASIMSNSAPSSAGPSRSATPAVTPLLETKPYLAMSSQGRLSREIARRGLYSRFFRGKVLTLEEEEEMRSAEQEKKNAAAGGSTSSVTQIMSVTEAGPSKTARSQVEAVKSKSKSSKAKGKETEGETEDEKKIRKAEKAKRKEEKEAKRALKAEKKAKKDMMISIAQDDPSESSGKKRKRRKESDEGGHDGGKEIALETGVGGLPEAQKKEKKIKGEKKRKPKSSIQAS